MGFAAGFAAGWGAVDGARRTKMQQEQAAAALAAQQEEAAARREDRQLEKDRRRAVSDAWTGDAQAGTAVGTNFAASKNDAAWLAQQAHDEAEMRGEQAPAAVPAASSGNAVRRFSDAGQAADFAAERKGETGRLRRLADAEARFGNTDRAINLEQTHKQLMKEGYKDALDLGLATGDWDQAAERFNGIGAARIPDGARVVGKPVQRTGKDGVTMPDYDLSLVMPDGSARPLGSALTMRYMADGVGNLRKMMGEEAAGGRDQQRLDLYGRGVDANIRQGDRRLDHDESRLRLDAANVQSQIAARGAATRLAGARFADERLKDGENPYVKKIGQYEKVIGRPLSEDERMAVMGLGKDKGKTDKFVDDAAAEWQKQTPGATPQDLAAFRENLRVSLGETAKWVDVAPKVRQVFDQYQQAGTMGDAVAAFKAKGGTDEQLRSIGIDPAAKNAAAKPGAGASVTPSPAAVAAQQAAPRSRVDPNSPAGRSQQRDAELRAEKDARVRAVREGFDADAAALPPVELVRKYDRMRGTLTMPQLRALRDAESRM